MPNPNKITNCLPVILLKINEYGVTATTMIRKSKTLNIVTSQTERRVASTTSRESYNYYNSKYMKSKRR